MFSPFKVPIIENSMCQEMFAAAGHTKKILPSFLCAGYANGQKDSKLDESFVMNVFIEIMFIFPSSFPLRPQGCEVSEAATT